jgi:hypothetical protein
MTAINKQRQGNDDILENVTDHTTGGGYVDGGLLVVPSTATTSNAGVQGFVVAGDAAKNVLGVTARKTLSVDGQENASTNDPDGFPFVNPDSLNELTAVWKGCVVPVTFTAAAVAYGTKLVAAAGGKVRAYVPLAEAVGTDATALTGDDPSAIVGECRAVVGAGGGVGLALIY